MVYVESIRSFLQRPYPVSSGTWSGDQSSGVMVTFDPLKVYLNLNVIKGKLEGFHFLRCGVRFEIRVNGTRFHYGQAVAAWVPLTGLRSYATTQLTPQALTMFPSVIVNPGPSEVGVLEVPYVHPYHLMPLTSGSTLLRSLGTFYLSILVPLRVASTTNVPVVSYTIYVSLVDPVVTGFSSSVMLTPIVAEEPAAIAPVGTVALVEQAGTDPVRFVPEAMNFLATDSPDISIAAGMQGRNSVMVGENVIGASRADMLLSNLYTRPNWVNEANWTSAHPVGHNILSIGVSPIANVATGTYLANLALISRFWTGSIRYHIRLVASAFHTGRVMITWEPNLDAGEASLLTIANRMTIVVDLQDAVDIYFTIPWMAATPWKTLDTLFGSRNGTIYVTVLNALAVPTGDVTTVTVLVWSYGSKDLRFALPQTSTEPEVVYELASRASTTESTRTDPVKRAPSARKKDLVQQCEVAPLDDSRYGAIAGSYSVPSGMAMGETLTTAQDWLLKMGLVFKRKLVFANPWTEFSIFRNNPLSGSAMARMQAMFVVQRGSVRYAAVMLDDEANPLPVFAVGPGYSNGIRYSAVQVRNAAPNSIIQVPYYCELNFVPTNLSAAGLSALSFAAPGIVIQGETPSLETHCGVWVGAGGDFMFAYPVPPP